MEVEVEAECRFHRDSTAHSQNCTIFKLVHVSATAQPVLRSIITSTAVCAHLAPPPTPSVYVIMASSVQSNDSGTVEQSASEITQSGAKYTAALYDQARMTSASVMDAAIGTGATAGSTAVCGVTSLGEIVVWALSNSVTTKRYTCIKRSHSHTYPWCGSQLAPIDSSTTAAASVSPARRVQAHAGSAYCCCTVNTDAGSVLVTYVAVVCTVVCCIPPPNCVPGRAKHLLAAAAAMRRLVFGGGLSLLTHRPAHRQRQH